MTKVRKKIGNIPINDIEQQVQQSTSAAITQMQQDVSNFIDEETAQYPEIGGTFKYTEDPEGKSEITTDSEGKILSYRDTNGVKHENVGIETPSIHLSAKGFNELHKELNTVGNNGDWTDYISNDGEKPLHLAKPRLAKLNLLTHFDNTMDLTKLSKAGTPYGATPVAGYNYDIPIEVEFWDMQGNYFKKKVLLSGQGNSTMMDAKKNIALDFFDSEWDGDAFKIKFGDWIPQDSFHLKAYMCHPLLGEGLWSYMLYDRILKTKGFESDYVWKNALWDDSANDPTHSYGANLSETDLYNDTGAKCFPDGFPVAVYENGAFWGLYVWQLKKHRDNFHMKKSNPEHIYLDGYLYDYNFEADGDSSKMQWDRYEVRNPKDLVYAEGQVDGSKITFKYDADLVQAEIAGTDKNYDGDWVAGDYAIGRVVKHLDNYFINQVASNDEEPVLQDASGNKNTATSPDFKNKTKCGWINCTNTIAVKARLLELSRLTHYIKTVEAPYVENVTNTTYWEYVGYKYDNLGIDEDDISRWVGDGIYNTDDHVVYNNYIFKALSSVPVNTKPADFSQIDASGVTAIKTEFEKYFNPANLIDYIVITDILKDSDAFLANWQWVTYGGNKWWVSLYDCDNTFGNPGGKVKSTFSAPLTRHAFEHVADVGLRKYFVILRYVTDYYSDGLNQRWKELRDSLVVDSDSIFDMIKTWLDSIGRDVFDLENKNWGSEKSKDNMMRLKKWIDQNISNLDSVYSYNNQ